MTMPSLASSYSSGCVSNYVDPEEGVTTLGNMEFIHITKTQYGSRLYFIHSLRLA